MTVLQLLEELRADGVSLDVVDGALRLSGPQNKIDPPRLAKLRAMRRDIERHLGQKPQALALSRAQLGLHMAERIDPALGAYNPAMDR